MHPTNERGLKICHSDGHREHYHNFSIERGALFFVFPGSKIAGLNPGNALELVRSEALSRFEKLKQAH
jgi:hypothetical protein